MCEKTGHRAFEIKKKLIFIEQVEITESCLVAQTVTNLTVMLETWFRSLGQERYPGEGNGDPLQYSCLEDPMDRGDWQATVHAVTKSWTHLSDLHFTFTFWRKRYIWQSQKTF